MQTPLEFLIIMKAIRNILDMGKPQLAQSSPFIQIFRPSTLGVEQYMWVFVCVRRSYCGYVNICDEWPGGSCAMWPSLGLQHEGGKEHYLPVWTRVREAVGGGQTRNLYKTSINQLKCIDI